MPVRPAAAPSTCPPCCPAARARARRSPPPAAWSRAGKSPGRSALQCQRVAARRACRSRYSRSDKPAPDAVGRAPAPAWPGRSDHQDLAHAVVGEAARVGWARLHRPPAYTRAGARARPLATSNNGEPHGPAGAGRRRAPGPSCCSAFSIATQAVPASGVSARPSKREVVARAGARLAARSAACGGTLELPHVACHPAALRARRVLRGFAVAFAGPQHAAAAGQQADRFRVDDLAARLPRGIGLAVGAAQRLHVACTSTPSLWRRRSTRQRVEARRLQLGAVVAQRHPRTALRGRGRARTGRRPSSPRIAGRAAASSRPIRRRRGGGRGCGGARVEPANRPAGGRRRRAAEPRR